MSNDSFDLTMIHGRFQPFHVGHLKYLRDALERTRRCLLVGITNPDSISTEVADGADEHRHLAASNPFSFVDRARMVSRSLDLDLKHSGIPTVLVVPFDIHRPDLWGFLPPETVQLVNILEEWDEEKVRRFRNAGFRVSEIPHDRITSGTLAREMLLSREDSSMILPKGTREVLDL